MIARVADEAGQRIEVTDRGKLSELRRRWDEKHFAVYELEQ